MNRSAWFWLLGLGAGAGLLVLLLRRQRRGEAGAPNWLTAAPEDEPAEVARRREKLMPFFLASSIQHSVPLPWLLAIARKETGFRNLRSAPSQRDEELGGAWGPLQVTSATAKVLGFQPKASGEARGRAILSEPATGIELGARYLARLVGEVGSSLDRVAAAYNAGPRLVLASQVPRSTRERYLPEVLRYAEQYASVS